jgi:hypothetical protein
MITKIKKPNFFIVGAPKCGTTSLSFYLREHPNVFFSKPKEPHHFSTDLSKRKGDVINRERYLNLFRGANSYKAVGEGSVWYLYSKVAVSKIIQFNPRAKFIVMIRNPVDMFRSLHSYLLTTLDEDIRDPCKAWELQKERSVGRFLPPYCRGSEYLQYGDICKLGEQIRRLFEIVPNNKNIKIIKFIDFKKNTKKHTRTSWRFSI